MIGARSDSLRGVLLMVLGAGLLVINDGVAKLLAERYPLGQILALRHGVSLMAVLGWVATHGNLAPLRVRRPGGQAVRVALFLSTATLMVLSLSLLPLTTVTAIAFASPLFVAALSVPLLGEHVGWRRWSAILVGFGGVLVIIRPGGTAFEWALLVPVLASMSSGLRDLTTRWLSRSETSLAMLFWSNAVLATAAALTLAWGWRSVVGGDIALVLLGGLLNAGAHFLIIEALRLGEAALIAPFKYSALLWASLFGVLVWGELPDAWVYLGAAIVAGSGFYIIRRESEGHRRGDDWRRAPY